MATHSRGFRLLLTARACSLFGSLMTPVAVAFVVLDQLNGDTSDIGVVLAAGLAGTLAFTLAGGVLADRISPCTVMIRCDLASCCVQVLAVGLLATHSLTVPAFAALLFVQSAVGALFRPASQAVLPRLVDRKRLQQANARLGLVTSVMVVVAPLTGGVLVAGIGPQGVLAVDAATFAVSALMMSRIHRVSPAATRSTSAGSSHNRLFDELRGGWRELTTRRWLWASILMAGLVEMAGSAPLTTLTPVLADDRYGGAQGYARMMAAMGLGAVVGGLIAARLPVRRHLLVLTALVIPLAAAPLTLALGAAEPVVLAIFAATGLAESVLVVLWTTVLGRTIPLEALGRVSSWDSLGSFVMRPAGHVLAGFLATMTGVAPVLWVAVAAFTLAPLPVLALRDVRAPLSVLENRPAARTAA